ncbi:MAG: glycosyltransferase family 2 protein [Bacteroidetes bacterium]|nr:MAG: glycosyltransferase family 2 protein [Bacteroidota bacterium]
MKVSGFSFIRNAITYDYPIVEAIQSILPLCDEVVIAVGKSDDATRELIASIDPKVRIIDTLWDDSLREGGRVLAVETDKAFAEISQDSDWAFYIQGDEVIHEKYHDAIRAGMQEHLDNPQVDGLLFNYLHFYGSYDYVGTSTKWYHSEIRIVRKRDDIFSFRDAQGFRKRPDDLLRVKALDAYVYHYGWVKAPEAMQKKQESFHKLWHDDQWMEQNIAQAESFDYLAHIKELGKFDGTHPKVMQARIDEKNWKFDYDISYNRTSLKDRFKKAVKKYAGLDFSYQNYKLLK